MVYYKIPYTGAAFDYPAGCILCRAYPVTGYMCCEFESVTSAGSDWVTMTASEFETGCPDFPEIPAPPKQELIATSATLTGGNIVLELPAAVSTGTMVKFTAPCACEAVTGGLSIDGTTYTVVDAMGATVTGVGGVWDSGSQIAVVIDKDNSKAYLQNGPTSELIKKQNIVKATYPIATGNSVTAGDVVDVVNGEVTRSVVAEANVETVFVTGSIAATSICRLNDNVSVVAYAQNGQLAVSLLDNQTGKATNTQGTMSGSDQYVSVVRLSDTKIVLSWSYSNQIYTRLATIAGNSISLKNTVQPTGNNSNYPYIVALDTDRFAIFYSSVGANSIDVNVGTVSGDTITYPGNGYSKSGCVPQYISATLLPNDSSGNKRVCVCFSDANDNNKGKAVIVTINSSNVVTWGSVVTFNNSESHSISCASNGNTVVVSYNNDSACYCRVLAVNGTSITAGSQTQFKTTEIRAGSFVVCISGKFVVLGYGYASGAIISGSYAIVLNVSGLNITVNTAYQFDTASASGLCACPISDNKLIAAYIDNGNNNYGTSTILEVNGNQIAGGFAMNSTQAIALQSGEAGQEIEVIFAGTTAADFITEGQKIPSDGVYGYGPMAGWLNVIPYWAKDAGVRIATGSYVGTGTYGASNPNSLAIGFNAAYMAIYPNIAFSNSCNQHYGVFLPGLKKFGTTDGNSVPAFQFSTISTSNGTITWYTTVNETYQLNTSGVVYYYIAIG